MGSRYEAEQERYMDHVHVPDSSSQQWESTLYGPLRQQVAPLLERAITAGARSFGYIGPGPSAPLVVGPRMQRLVRRLSHVTLFDISKRYLRDATTRLAALGMTASTTPIVHDITHGNSTRFHTWVHRHLAAFANGEKVSAFQYNEPQLHGENAELRFDFIYSELVATYTGVPAIFSFEQETGLLAEQNDLLLMAWQQYNEAAVSAHLSELLTWAAPGGTVVVATDVEKVHLGKGVSPISSFHSLNPLSEHGRLTSHDESIMWDDTAAHEHKTAYFRPHHHRVGVYVYR